MRKLSMKSIELRFGKEYADALREPVETVSATCCSRSRIPRPVNAGMAAGMSPRETWIGDIQNGVFSRTETIPKELKDPSSNQNRFLERRKCFRYSKSCRVRS
eukprot:IDg20329t1